jgi:purine-binding chemotaxis protein CheW
VLGRGQGEARIQAIFRWEAGGRLVSVLAAEHLLHKELTDRLLAGAQRGESGASQAMSDASEAFLTFSIGGQAFGLPIAAVIEVALPPAALTRLPNAPAFVLGLMNHRGQAIAVIDQASRFEANSADETRARVVVARSGALEVGFLVESVSGVLRVPASAIRPAPEFGAHARIFDRVAVGGEQLVLIVSPDELLGRAERDLLAGLAQGRSGAA